MIELMIVVAIIGVLSAIGYPGYVDYVKKAGRSDAYVGMTKIADKQERYYLQNNTYTTTLADLNANSASEEGYYTFAVTSADLVSGFTVTATAVTGGAQATDTGCTTMTLTSTGVKEPNGNPSTEEDCW